MPRRHRLTNNSDETDISALISGDNIFAIPYFQRPYKWKLNKLRQLNKDILHVVDAEDYHFLGAVIVHGRRSNPSDPDVFDVIDGQQRLTTLIIYLCAVVRILCLHKHHKLAANLFLKYLVVARDTTASNLKLHPCKEDRAQLNAVYQDLMTDRVLHERLGSFRPKYLPADDRTNGRLRLNYRSALRFLKNQAEHEGLERIHAIYRAILERMSVVQIDVKDPTNGPKIFDSLNSRQEPMTIGDLVRNEIFSRVADAEPDVLEEIDANEWQPFYRRFWYEHHNCFDAYFFPYGLIRDPHIKKADVYASLRKEWETVDAPRRIIAQLRTYQDAFLDLIFGTNKCGHPIAMARLFRQFHEMTAPSSAYPFLMQLANAARDGKVSAENVNSTLSTIESFLVRRAVCGHEPTGLHAVFKRLWTDCQDNPNGDRVQAVVAKHSTVVWPTDEHFQDAIGSRRLDDTRVVRYVLVSLDRVFGGDQPEGTPWVEHVWPKKPSKDWQRVFSESRHKELRGVLANLIPLSSELNRQVSNNGYTVKRKHYARDSMYITAREFAKDFDDWTPEALKQRSERLAEMAVRRWPY